MATIRQPENHIQVRLNNGETHSIAFKDAEAVKEAWDEWVWAIDNGHPFATFNAVGGAVSVRVDAVITASLIVAPDHPAEGA
ncbi:MAG: hypothetical protein AAGK74_00320 [Chloroflexota bacterium]